MIIKKHISKLNDFVAIKSVVIMSTMGCVFAFLVWSLLPLFFPKITDFVAYVSADIIQLVALPLIMVGQKIAIDNSSQNHSLLAERHDEIQETLEDIREVVKKLDEENELLKTIANNQQLILDKLDKPKRK